MDRRHHIPRLCFALTAGLTLLGVVLRSVCMLCFFDVDPGYFVPGPLATASDLLYFAAVLAPTVCMILTPKDALSREPLAPRRFPFALLLGLTLTAFTVISLLISFPARKSDVMLTPSLLGVVTATYYIVSAKRDGRYPDGLAFLGYLPVFWNIAAVAETYFDNFTTMNGPVKISLHMGFLGFMMISLAELRVRVNKPSPRYSVAFLSIGSYACLVGSIPLLLALLNGNLSNLRHILYASVLLAAGLYGFYLLLRYTHSPAPVVAEATPESPKNAE